ncbi:MAG: FAD-binding oxidoreductase [Armatimonadetes bacterium]|nr:FAD-binding oxidoreductase [Armatimonadota bacterium]CUU36577.1 sarcosine oxidase subunit beta [Armatimonadetes bacterium DC]
MGRIEGMAYEVIVVGAGVIGVSVAYHLSALGQKGVLVLERAESLGAGSTGKATGGFRCQFTTEINVRLSMLSREKLLRFPEEIGVDSGYRPYGYLFCATTEAQMGLLRQALAVQHAAGVHAAREVAVDEIRQINPALRTDDLVGGTFCDWDGFTRPMQILEGYWRASQRLGVEYRFGVPSVRLWREGERIRGVEVGSERIEAGAVVNACGAWAAELARTANLRLPVTPVKRQVAQTYPFDKLPETMPMSIDVSDGFHLRVRDGRVLLLYPHGLKEEHTLEPTLETEWLEIVHQRACQRVPCLAEARIDPHTSWAGLYEMSPDRHAIVGEAPECRGLYLVNGSSGHGVMHAPALGEIVARLILGLPLPVDITPLRPTRFAENALNPETGVL